MRVMHLKREIAQRELSDLCRKPSVGKDHITKRLRLAIMCSFRCFEDLPTCGEGGIRTHGGRKDHNGFRDRPNRPLWHTSLFPPYPAYLSPTSQLVTPLPIFLLQLGCV
jgi:hypothetical protein